MNLQEIRAEARSIRSQTRGIFLLFAGPTLISIISYLLALDLNLREIIPALSFQQTIVFLASREIGPRIIQFILTLLFLSASFSLMEVVRKKREEVGFSDINRIFSKPLFGPIFATMLVKQLLLLLWNALTLAGLLLTTFNSYKTISIYDRIPNPSSLTSQSPEVLEILQYAPGMFLGLLLMAAGTAVFIPQAYAYSQTDYILYDQLHSGTYKGPFQVLRQSRRLMKGRKWDRFLLDLSFIGWYILIGLTYGIAGITVYPYISAAQVLFYEKIRQEKKLG
ncbi:membrane protein [Streptococcus sp. DD11]|uniref:DUF975 family protein n=1 Tax=Streptococcus sp. DD11 TaxID=1777879 RepID=UPI0007995662|nr:DUF975 family protein [Streptococcus sp. DD11]KXT77392.1 membrane protein [Streptococcus sp. DD11]